jgi:hypothetical protein
MYTQTLSKTIAEAIEKLLDLKGNNLVYGRPLSALTDAQTEAFADHTEKSCYYDEDMALALANIFVNLNDDHIYVLEMCDGEDDTLRYYYADIAPQIHLRQDENGELERSERI